MYKTKRKFAWKLTEVQIKLPDGTVELNDIALDFWYMVQQQINGIWTDIPDSRWYSEVDAYEEMKHLICKEETEPVTQHKYSKN